MEGPKFNLNDLAQKAREEQAPVVEKTTEEKIEELRARIAVLEEKAAEPTKLEKFQALNPEEQETEIARMNDSVPENERHTIESYIAEISPKAGRLDVNKTRLLFAKDDLERLLAE